MPEPTDVPRCTLSRLIAARTAFWSLVGGWVAWFGGRQSVRSIQVIVAWLLVAFALVHVFQVIVTGLWNNLRSMITGRYRVPQEVAHE